MMHPKFTVFCLASICFFVFSACTQENKTPKATAVPDQAKPVITANVISEQSGSDTLKGSLKSEARGRIGSANIKISYHSPAVRERVVWGGLVPFSRVWVTGAHSATSFETDRQLKLGGEHLAAGKYALFTIPGKDGWIIIINKNWQQHLADSYSPGEDIIRLNVKPQTLSKNQERLRFQIQTDSPQKGKIVFTWEKMSWSVPVTL